MRSEAHDAATRPAPSVQQSLREYGRGVAGGLLFSLPLLFTMEMWDAGATSEPWRLLVGIVGVFILLLGYNRYAGLHADACLSEVVVDSIEEFGLGLLLSAAILWLIGSIDAHTRLPELVGKVVLEGLAVAIGVSVGTAQLGGDSGDEDKDEDKDEDNDEDNDEDEDAQDPHQPRWFLGQLTLATCGAVLIAANIAPTDEIPDIARTITPVQQLGLTAATLLVGALVLYASDFHGARDHVRHRGHVDVLSGTVVNYLISIGAAATLLWFFGRFDDCGPAFCLAQSIVLGLPTAIGASAGRLLLQPSSS
jgi:putative integral membrane protein (TIGR02587 family)